MGGLLKIGLIARGEDRGLGIQTWEAFRHLKPERTLLIDMGELARGFLSHADRYPGATIARYERSRLSERLVRGWLRGLDVVLTCETFYDWRIIGWANELGVATVNQVNPEFYLPDVPRPTVTWAPTRWRLDKLPKDTVVVPVPVALDRVTSARRSTDGTLTVLHVAGHRAAGDRNGTGVVAQAVRAARRPWRLRVVTQDNRLATIAGSRYVKVERKLNGVANYWDLYRDADVLALPRRYGGLCLPAQEALAAGLIVVMPDCEPNRDWPVVTVEATLGGLLKTPTGEVQLANVSGRSLAMKLDELAGDPAWREQLRERGLAWAQQHSWDALLPLYQRRLEEAIEKKGCTLSS